MASSVVRHQTLDGEAAVCAGEDPAVMSFKIIDFGHARLLGDKRGASLPGSPQMEKWYRRCPPPCQCCVTHPAQRGPGMVAVRGRQCTMHMQRTQFLQCSRSNHWRESQAHWVKPFSGAGFIISLAPVHVQRGQPYVMSLSCQLELACVLQSPCCESQDVLDGSNARQVVRRQGRRVAAAPGSRRHHRWPVVAGGPGSGGACVQLSTFRPASLCS